MAKNGFSTPERIIKLEQKYRNDDIVYTMNDTRKNRDILFAISYKVAVGVGKRIYNNNVSNSKIITLDDSIQNGYLGINEASNRWLQLKESERRKYYSFNAYATPWVNKYIQSFFEMNVFMISHPHNIIKDIREDFSFGSLDYSDAHNINDYFTDNDDFTDFDSLDGIDNSKLEFIRNIVGDYDYNFLLKYYDKSIPRTELAKIFDVDLNNKMKLLIQKIKIKTKKYEQV
ncbi:hypothetical protein BPT24_222 [Tenacibaculum phage pT24]|uniref:Uncharacterized protein n=1 Tax=Tenacibaculum phage pT24 TaxID=1880590 RepID=A0A1B4XX01_9CAUD|nr:hypothetical protein HYP10_gp222 [Tenacibaculum phage pT24]BAV39346.1 hypothetical protein BPT24_222 [Tenacibaculum phage pT24]